MSLLITTSFIPARPNSLSRFSVSYYFPRPSYFPPICIICSLHLTLYSSTTHLLSRRGTLSPWTSCRPATRQPTPFVSAPCAAFLPLPPYHESVCRPLATLGLHPGLYWTLRCLSIVGPSFSLVSPPPRPCVICHLLSTYGDWYMIGWFSMREGEGPGWLHSLAVARPRSLPSPSTWPCWRRLGYLTPPPPPPSPSSMVVLILSLLEKLWGITLVGSCNLISCSHCRGHSDCKTEGWHILYWWGHVFSSMFPPLMLQCSSLP